MSLFRYDEKTKKFDGTVHDVLKNLTLLCQKFAKENTVASKDVFRIYQTVHQLPMCPRQASVEGKRFV